MDVQDYCKNVEIELVGWKAKLYDVVRKADKMYTGQKEKVVPLIGDMQIMLEELENRVKTLEKECPTKWSPQQNDIEGRMTSLRDRWTDMWGKVSMGDIGG